jgi:peptidoglycan hydrolase-like protein with peptidoglycan-binding domain
MKIRACLLLVTLLFSVCLPTQAVDTSQYQTLTVGSTGADVAALKQRMYELGYFKNNVVNQTFTSKTAEYVKEFERINGFYVDGIADPEMQTLFYSDKALPKSAGDSVTATSEPTATPAPTATPEPASASLPDARIPLQINDTPQPPVMLSPDPQTGDDGVTWWRGVVTVDTNAPTKTEYDFGGFKVYVPHDFVVYTLDTDGVRGIATDENLLYQNDQDIVFNLFQSNPTLYLVSYDSSLGFYLQIYFVTLSEADDIKDDSEATIRSELMQSLKSLCEENGFPVYDTDTEAFNQTTYVMINYSFIDSGGKYYRRNYYSTVKLNGCADYSRIEFDLFTYDTAATDEMIDVVEEILGDVVYE